MTLYEKHVVHTKIDIYFYITLTHKEATYDIISETRGAH